MDPLMHNNPRAPRRGGATSRMSIASSHSNTSNQTGQGARHHHWQSTASAGTGTRHSREANMPQYVPDTLSPTVMNISGSSSLIPLAREHRDGHRSLSMTIANTSEPTFPLSSNRSLASLRGHEPPHPYMYPTRLKKRPGYRPVSPALSDTAGAYPRRQPAYLEHGFPPYPGPPRPRRPSEISVRRPPSRSRTPVIYGDPHPDIPPVPPLMPHRHAALERERERELKLQKSHRTASHKSGKNSISSGSTNRRFDVDIPSSDSTSPPTPRDGDILVSPTGTQSMPRNMSGTVNYYDYSEQYEDQEALETSAGAVPTGLVRHIKTIIEERGTPEPTSKGGSASATDRVADQHVDAKASDISELPASPVPRRITRDLVLAGIGPESSSGEVETSGLVAETRSSKLSLGDSHGEQMALQNGVDRRAVHLARSTDVRNRHSILSQAGSSVMDSSTLEFAVRYSIPMVAEKGMTLDLGNKTAPVYVSDADPTSEDGMTDLLEGYQRTDTKYGSEQGAESPPDQDERGEKRSNHAAKSSDEQSFKSCTDVIKADHSPVKQSSAILNRSCESPPQTDPPSKDSDAKSFRTCKDAVTPEYPASLPAPRQEYSHVVSEPLIQDKHTEILSSLPSVSGSKAPQPSTSDSSMSRIVARFRTDSKPNLALGSTRGSFSSLKESGVSTPPSVPPRQSSSSKEAQQSRGVTNFLLRSVRQRFTKSSPGSKLKPSKEGAASMPGPLNESNPNPNIPTPPPMKDRVPGTNIVSAERRSEVLKPPHRVLIKDRILPHKQGTAHKQDPLIKASSINVLPESYPGALSTPSPVIMETSSIYSHRNVSSSEPFSQTSPITFPRTPEQRRRDSQSTTHLSWIRTNSLNSYSVENARPGRSSQEDSTTDLRLPGGRHPIYHLPDLKEESHEDSSLNTSASNFRPCSGSQPTMFRKSTDGMIVPRRQPSVRSSRGSVLQQMHLPSMNFSSFRSFDEALDPRVSRSLDLAPAARQEWAEAVMPRPASADDGREKYKSVFAGLDTPARSSTARQHTSVDFWIRKSPDVITRELDSLTIPSVHGLTTRLTEMLPKLREALGLSQADEFPEEEGIMEKAMESLNEVGLPAQKRSSARLRPVPGSPNMLVVDDEVFKEITTKEINHAPLVPGISRDQASRGIEKAAQGGRVAQGESATVLSSGVASHIRTRDGAVINTAELKATSPTHLRQHNTTDSPPGNSSFPSFQPSTQSFSRNSTPTGTVTDTRPWNLDKNYPWATDPSVDISLPPPSASKHSPRPGPSHLRNHLSSASLESTGTCSPYGTSASPSARRAPTEDCYNFVVDSTRSPEPSSVDFSASGHRSRPVRVRDENQSHGAGERYPTSALPLPPNLHLYPGQASHYSLDISDEEAETTSPRKTLFSRRPRHDTRASTRGALSQSHVRELQHSRETDHSAQVESDNLPNRTRRQTFANAQGMSKLSFCLQSCGLFFKKAFLKIVVCGRPDSPSESDSTDVTVPANTRTSSSTDSSTESQETVRLARESADTFPPIRDGPGRRFTPGYLISFPSLAATTEDAVEPVSAFESNIKPRKHGPVDPEAAASSTSN